MDEAAAVVEAWSAKGTAFSAAGIGSRVWSEGSGEPVLCLHGVPASSFLYRKVLASLAARGLRGVAIDFPGLGLAERPTDFGYTWTDLSAWTAAAVDVLALDRFHLIVHDIGGPVGFDLIRRMPERIRSLTVLNTLVRVAEASRPWIMKPFAVPVIGPLYVATTTPFIYEKLMRFQGVASPVPSAELRAYNLLLKRVDGGKAFLQIMRRFELTEDLQTRILSALSARKFPAAVAWGAQDPALPIETLGEIAKTALGLSTIERLPGKHFVQEDSPDAIAEIVARLAVEARNQAR